MKTEPKTIKPKSTGLIRAWLRGAFTMAAIVSFAINYATCSGRLSMQPSTQVSDADYISAAEALKPVKLSRNGR